MIIKEGVSIRGLQPEMMIALMVANDLYKANNQELVVTSGTEGIHKRNSRHYIGYAVDLRHRYYSNEMKAFIVKELQSKLGEDFLVLLERTHIHVSYKPKG